MHKFLYYNFFPMFYVFLIVTFHLTQDMKRSKKSREIKTVALALLKQITQPKDII